MHMFRIKRVYLSAEATDGYRVLVDRIWPRGLTKEAAAADLWLKEIAPSTELRKWFNHEEARWPEFQVRYRRELQSLEVAEAFETLARIGQEHAVVTLLFGAKDEARNQAVALLAVLNEKAP